MPRCAVCRAKVRKTAMVYVSVDGKLRRSRICGGCAKDTVTVHVGSSLIRCLCGGLATQCIPCGIDDRNKDRREILLTEAARIRGIAGAYYGTNPERAEGLRQAADLIEGQCRR